MDASPEVRAELEELERQLAAVSAEENLALAHFVREMNNGLTPGQAAVAEQTARRFEERARTQVSSGSR